MEREGACPTAPREGWGGDGTKKREGQGWSMGVE